MKIAFINPSLRPNAERIQLPVGLAYVVTAAKKAGFEFDIIDMDINHLSMKDLKDIVRSKDYGVFALGCIVSGFKYVKEIAEIVKKNNPKALIVVGNSVATSIPEILLNNTKSDIAVMGEADVTIVELLRAIERKKKLDEVKGIAFRKNGRIIFTKMRPVVENIDVFGFPDWDLFELDKYNEYGHINVNAFSDETAFSKPLNSARGCPFDCTFCYHVFKGEKYRRYSIDAVIEEIKRLHYKYDCNYIAFWDELTFQNIKSVRELVAKLKTLDFKIRWAAPSRGNLFKREHLDLIKELREVGCVHITSSLENGSPEILSAMNKKLKVPEFVEQAKVLAEGGVTPLTSIIFGYPQETPDTIGKTLDICDECNIYPSSGFLLPMPGTPIYEWAKEHGKITDELEYLMRIGDRQDFHINLTNMSDDEFIHVASTKLEALAKKQGLGLKSVFKTISYQKPKVAKETRY